MGRQITKAEFRPIGFVTNSVKKRGDMTLSGTLSKITIYPEFRKAMEKLDASHIWVVGYLHNADTSVLKAKPRKISSSLQERGVFAMRSPDRPNPVSISCVKAISVSKGIIKVDHLDLVDGTPILDIKPYSPGIDCITAASAPDYSKKYSMMTDAQLVSVFARTVRNACGRINSDGIKAITLALAYTRYTGHAPETPARLTTNLKKDGLDGITAIFRTRPSRTELVRITGGKCGILALDDGKKMLTVFAEPSTERQVRALTRS